MVIDSTFTYGNLAEITTIIVGGIAVLMTLKADVAALKAGAAKVERELAKIAEIMVNLAEVRGEINVISQRVLATERDISEMKQHGNGFVKSSRL